MGMGSDESTTCANLSVAFPRSVSLLSRTPFRQALLEVQAGELPRDLQGSAFLIGPGGSLDDVPLEGTDLIQPSHDGTPLFNGDPLVYRLDFDDHSVKLTSNIPRTPCFYTDKATVEQEEFKDLRYGNYGLARLSFTLGFRNEVNTAFQPMRFHEQEGFRLLITWDAGRPYEIDPVSLEVVTPVGGNDEWREQIKLGLPFGIVTTTAHTAFDPNSGREGRSATLFSVNYGKSISTALRPIFTNEAGEELPQPVERTVAELRQVLNAIEARISWVLEPLRTLLMVEEGLLNVTPVLFRSVIVNLHRQVNSRVANLISNLRATALEVEKLLPRPLALPDRPLYRRLLEGVLEVMEEIVEEDIFELRRYLEEIVRLVGVAKGLLKAAEAMEDFVDLIAWDGEHQLRKWSVLIEQDGKTMPPRIYQSMHQIAVSEDYLILMDTVFKLGAEQLLTSPAPRFPKLERIIRDFLDFRQSDDTVVYIVSRKDLTADHDTVVARRVVIPRSAAHFLVNHENPGGRLTLHMAHNNGWDPAEWTRPYDRFPYSEYPRTLGMATSGTDINFLGRYEIDAESGNLLNSTLSSDVDHTWMTAIYTYSMPDGITPLKKLDSLYWISWGCRSDLLSGYIADLYRNSTYREVPLERVIEITRQGLPVNLIRLDCDQMQVVDSYEFPPGCFGNSPQFIPRRGHSEEGSSNGYLLCVVHSSDEPCRSEFWLFDAACLNKGPVCKLSHPKLAIGMTIHTTWLPSLNSRETRYYISPEEDYRDRIERMPGDNKALVGKLFKQHVYPHFPAQPSSTGEEGDV